MVEGRRGRPRDPRSQEAIVQATCELLGEVGYERMTIEAVASRAGVGKQTVYRWWASKGGLVAEAVLTGHLPLRAPPLADTGDLRADLGAWLDELTAALSDDRTASLVRATAAAAADDEQAAAQLYDRFTGPAHQAVVARLAAAVVAGHVRPDADLAAAADALTGALLYRVLTRQDAVPPQRSHGLLGVVLSGLRPDQKAGGGVVLRHSTVGDRTRDGRAPDR